MASTSALSSGLVLHRGWFESRASPICPMTFVSSRRRGQRWVCAALGRKSGHGNMASEGRLFSLSKWLTVEYSYLINHAIFCRASSGHGGGLAEVEMEGEVEGEVEEEIRDPREDFVEVGYISGLHGVQGELRVHSLTDFPQERFQTPGMRWLRAQPKGRHSFYQVELLSGRIGPGKRPTWLITLKDFETPEKAIDLVGCTMLAAEEERPALEDWEFYIPDLVGMTVALQKSGEEIGVVLDVYSTGGGHDLLKVGLLSSPDKGNGRYVWVPFVEPIVPIVDKERKRVEIVPPKGLLELNAPKMKKVTRENQKEGVKQKRKFRGKFAGLKKRLTSMGQTQVLDRLDTGTKDERETYLEELLSIDFSVLQQAVVEDNQVGITAFTQQFAHLNLNVQAMTTPLVSNSSPGPSVQ